MFIVTTIRGKKFFIDWWENWRVAEKPTRCFIKHIRIFLSKRPMDGFIRFRPFNLMLSGYYRHNRWL